MLNAKGVRSTATRRVQPPSQNENARIGAIANTASEYLLFQSCAPLPNAMVASFTMAIRALCCKYVYYYLRKETKYPSASSFCTLSWWVSILKDNGMFQTNCIVYIKRQSQSQLIVRSAVITSVMSVLLCREMRGALFLSGARHDNANTCHVNNYLFIYKIYTHVYDIQLFRHIVHGCLPEISRFPYFCAAAIIAISCAKDPSIEAPLFSITKSQSLLSSAHSESASSTLAVNFQPRACLVSSEAYVDSMGVAGVDKWKWIMVRIR